jgi:hypothetical protein
MAGQVALAGSLTIAPPRTALRASVGAVAVCRLSLTARATRSAIIPVFCRERVWILYCWSRQR